MSLRLIYGRAGSGKSCFCLEEIKKNIDEEREGNLVLLVPEQFSFQSQKNFLKIIGEGGQLRAEVLDFKRMAYKVFNEIGGVTRKHMDNSGKCMLLYHILQNKKEEFKTFDLAARQKGFVNTLSAMFSEFKRFNVSPELLQQSIGSIDNDQALKEKLSDISNIYSEFEDTLHKNYIDGDDDLTILADKIDKWEYLKGAEVWIDEFSSFTPQQYTIIEKLLKLCSRVNITLCSNDSTKGVSDTEVFAVTANTERRLIKLAQENNISLEKSVSLNNRPFPRFKGNEEIAFLEQELYSFPYKKYEENTKSISLFTASNTYSEVESTARQIVRLCREEGFRYKDIAVITGDLSRYEKLVSAIFSEYDIPYFIDQKKDIQGNLIVVLINSVIEIFNKNWSYEAMFRYLKTGLTGISREDIDVLENYCIATGVRGKSKWVQAEPWDTSMERAYNTAEPSERELELLNRINTIRKEVILPLVSLHEKIKGKNKVRATAKALYEFLCELQVFNKVEAWIKNFEEEGNRGLINEYSQIWNIVMAILDQMVEVLGDEELNLEQFSSILEIGFNQHKMGLIPPSLDQVLVGSVDRIKSHEISVLFIIGVNDSVFPSSSNEEGILTDQDRAILLDKGVELAKDTKSRAFEEQFLVYTSLTLANKYLKLSYPIADFEGKTQRASIIISRLKTLYPSLSEESDIIFAEKEEAMLELVAGRKATFNSLVAALRRQEDGEENSGIWKDVYCWYANNEDWKEKCDTVFSGISYSNQVKMIRAEKIKKLYGENANYSVSRFEKYVQCPFSYYVQYGLKAKERKNFKLSAPDLGSFMHSVIDKFSRGVTENDMQWQQVDKSYCEREVSQIVDTLVEAGGTSIFNSSPRYSYLTKRLKRVLTRTMLIITEQIRKGGFVPVAYEMEFRQGSSYPPIMVELSNGEKINIIGKIDRIDMLEREGATYIRIVDYKSGSKEFKLSDVYFGLQIQLLLYLDAVISNEGKDLDNSVLPGGVLYYKIDDPLIKMKKKMSEEELDKEILKALKMRGLLLNDVDIIKEMDRDCGQYSTIIPAGIKKDGTLGSATSGASIEQFEELKTHIRKNLSRCCEEMLKGDIAIRPIKKKSQTGCDYCMYASVCQFDTALEDNKYKIINDLKDEEVWSRLNAEGSEE